MARKRAASEIPEMMQMRRAIGIRLEAVRSYFGLSQEDVGKALGIGQSGYQRWEAGRCWPNPYLILQFCAKLNVDFNFIYAGSLSGLPVHLAAGLVASRPQITQPTFRKGPRKGRSAA